MSDTQTDVRALAHLSPMDAFRSSLQSWLEGSAEEKDGYSQLNDTSANDVRAALEMGSPMGIRSPWVRKVAEPMLAAQTKLLAGDLRGSVVDARRCEDALWRGACLSWLLRFPVS